ncbi:hypothetical protein CROQUDRAFT_689841 [Cronartium quercuum f. sp. fusiforme G11]|uniref:CCHC-type domain-containing protein n=1 Tax=Cronartium quercuum f. sp. fusiforme G11 TaxID=708437 RepID=A0A9P6T696_9BASI|nr:hypothetical protein CROQUDRAFT_689841 [Cronartium quercuum f. sp. fusiforme G11]
MRRGGFFYKGTYYRERHSDEQLPQCYRCWQMGHTARGCKNETTLFKVLWESRHTGLSSDRNVFGFASGKMLRMYEVMVESKSGKKGQGGRFTVWSPSSKRGPSSEKGLGKG